MSNELFQGVNPCNSCRHYGGERTKSDGVIASRCEGKEMSYDKILETVKNWAHMYTTAEITGQSRFTEDLEFDELDLVCLVMDMEQELDIEIEETNVLNFETVGQLVEAIEDVL